MLQCTCKQKTVIIEGVSFIATLSIAALLPRKPTSAGISYDSWGAQDNHKRNRLYMQLRAYSFRSVYIILLCMAD